MAEVERLRALLVEAASELRESDDLLRAHVPANFRHESQARDVAERIEQELNAEGSGTVSEHGEAPEADGCGYIGRDFGAWYLDSYCVGGCLYDVDSTSDWITLPCPACNHNEWLWDEFEKVSCKGYADAEAGCPQSENPYITMRLRYPQDRTDLEWMWLHGWTEYHNECRQLEQTEICQLRVR